jgi:allantoin racemase
LQQDNLESLVALANRAILETKADVMIFAGAPLSGLAHKVRARIPAPVIDPIAAAVRQTEALIALRPRKATIASFQRPAAKTSLGLAAPLAAYTAHRDE